MGKLTVFGNYSSTCTRRVLMALAEKEATCDFKSIDFTKGEHKNPEYVAKNQPFGQVPVLWDDDFRVFESRPICRYIDDTVSTGTKLVPQDPKQKALVEQWISVEMSHYKACDELVYELFFKQMYQAPPDAAKVADATKRLHATLAVMDAQLASTKYLAGDEFTLADLVYMPYTHYLLHKCEGYANTFEKFPNVQRWWSAISSRPTWQKVSSQY